MQKVWQSMPITLKGGGCTVDLVFPGSSPTSQQKFSFFFGTHSALHQNWGEEVYLHVLRRGY